MEAGRGARGAGSGERHAPRDSRAHRYVRCMVNRAVMLVLSLFSRKLLKNTSDGYAVGRSVHINRRTA